MRPIFPVSRFLLRAGAIVATVALLTSCATPHPPSHAARGQVSNGIDAGAPVDFTAMNMPPSVPPAPQSIASDTRAYLQQPAQLSAAEIYPARGPQLAAAGISNATRSDANGVTINFAGADVRQVVDILLGETLGLNYTVDPRVQAKITARTVKPIPRDTVLETLESILASNDIAIVPAHGVYQIVPMDSVSKRIPGPRGAQSGLGFGLHIIPLHYVGAKEIAAVLTPYVPPERSLQILESKNVLLFNGTGAEAQQIEDLVDVFDVDWLRGRTFALLPVTYANADSITTELEQVFGVSGSQGLISFTPITRLNAILAMSNSPAYINEAKTWVGRLDRNSIGAGKRTYVYQVQNARAAQLAKTLQSLYGDQEAQATDSVAPSLTPATLSHTPGSNGISGEGLTSGISAPKLGQPGVTAFETKTGVKVVADDSKNALLISANREQYQEIESVLRQLDTVPLQVEIEATIAEVSLTDNLRYGLQWFIHSNSQANATLSTGTSNVLASAFPGFSYVLNATNANAILDALSKITKVRVVSSPHILVLDNEQGMFQVGDQVPVATRSSVSTVDPNAPVVNQIEFRDTGVILQVTPRVNSNGLILLDITQEVSDVVATTTSKIDSPTVRQRKLASAVVVESGKTVALGGLIRDSTTNDKAGVPFLSEIPILGNAFRATSDNRDRTELLVLITPRISRDANDSQALTDELRSRLSSLKPLESRLQPGAGTDTGVMGRIRRGSSY